MVTKRLEMEQTYLYDISVQDRHAVGIVVTVPEQELEIIQIRCKKGMLLCGIFHPDVVEKIRVPAGIFSAPTINDMLANKPIFLSQAAKEMGANLDMTGDELMLLFASDDVSGGESLLSHRKE